MHLSRCRGPTEWCDPVCCSMVLNWDEITSCTLPPTLLFQNKGMFLWLALPIYVFSEFALCAKTPISLCFFWPVGRCVRMVPTLDTALFVRGEAGSPREYTRAPVRLTGPTDPHTGHLYTKLYICPTFIPKEYQFLFCHRVINLFYICFTISKGKGISQIINQLFFNLLYFFF